MQLSYLKPILCNLKFKLPVPIYLFRLDINGVLKYLLKMGSAREWKEHVFLRFFYFIYLFGICFDVKHWDKSVLTSGMMPQ